MTSTRRGHWQLRVHIGERSTVVSISGEDVDRILGDEGVRRKVTDRSGLPWLGLHCEAVSADAISQPA
jgi:hypothetical protein